MVWKNGVRQLKSGDPVQEFECGACGKKFTDRTGTLFAGTRLSKEIVEEIITRRNQGEGLREIARSTGCSHKTVREIEMRLEKTMVVSSEDKLNPFMGTSSETVRMGGNNMEFNKKTGYIFIKTYSDYTKKVFENFKTYDWMIGAWLVTGEYDIIAWVNAKNDEDLYRYANKLRNTDGVEHTNSHYVYNAYVDNFDHLNNPNGAWVRIRGENMETIPTHLKDYKFIGGWANIPGEYDYLVYVYGNTHQETMENVLKMTENRKWRTMTHIPVYTYINKNYPKNF